MRESCLETVMADPVSIIIPAHNEAKVIAHSLAALQPGIADGSLEVIVVCNGCTDSTAKIVEAMDPSIICLVTPDASKSKALNLGDGKARYFPRIYQDADVVISLNSVRRMAQVLREGPFLAAAPTMLMEYHKASWAVRSFYEVWQELPYVREGMIGVGAYALSEEGRLRFDSFPDIVADDGFVRALFQPHERTSVGNAQSLVRAPKNLSGLIAIKSRSRRGQWELAQKFPHLVKNQQKMYGKAISPLIQSPSRWPKLLVYLYANLAARVIAKRRSGSGGWSGWERDETSRDAAVGKGRESGGFLR